ncbi:MAG TPA: prenyltransferase/squalene oxidase repeat-containing protein [Solirubrobacteraceae bacterium]|nr:prenyltransferase/squalene oxidase repeat-containing protein [Solirubrobacteraceae bacterium]
MLAVALAGGFAWYERAKPDARIVALVATLAAFAAIGRIAFAAFPNVKPTTDIVLIAGYALGGGPGFVVGAVAALTSNFFFGQGPWTPWQMAAWGVTGWIGAALALATAGRLRRVPLAIVCAVAGFAFAAAQDFGDWVNFSDHSFRALQAYVGTGIGFDLIDAAGCVVFALAFGPWLLRSVQRFARRLQVTWLPAGTAVPLLLVVVVLPVAVARAAATPAQYLLAAQNADGGFGGAPGQPSSSLFAGWAALGLAAAGENPADVSHGGASLLAYIESNPGTDVGSIERTMLVAGAAGVRATSFGGRDLVMALEHHIKADGSVQDQVNLTSFAVLAFKAVGVAPPAKTLPWLIRQQDSDGGFNFSTAGGSSDVDDTGAALEALAGVPGAAHARARAIHFIRAEQNRDGGFPSLAGGTSNAQSTAWAVQGLLAAGVDPATLKRNPDGYLGGLTGADGHISYSRGTDQSPVWVTAEAEMALVGKPLPLAAVARATAPVRKRRARRAARAPAQTAAHRVKRAHKSAARRPAGDLVAAGAALLAALALAPVGG